MDITVKPELPGMNIFIHLDDQSFKLCLNLFFMDEGPPYSNLIFFCKISLIAKHPKFHTSHKYMVGKSERVEDISALKLMDAVQTHK